MEEDLLFILIKNRIFVKKRTNGEKIKAMNNE
jgi:hypothetical protein